MKRRLHLAVLALCLSAPLAAGALVLQDSGLPVDRLPAELGLEVPFGLPEHLAADPAERGLAALGRRLFFDPLLSLDQSRSCASCHIPEQGFADNQRFSEGIGGKRTLRNTPTLFNRAMGEHFMWLGEASSLEQQALLPIENPLEMGLDLETALERLRASPAYAEAFQAVFSGEPTGARLAQALAAFVRRLLVGNSRVDRFRIGDRDVLSQAERGGLWFFESRGGCWRCHSGPNFTDEAFHNTGVGLRDGQPEPGRESVSGAVSDRGAFKTPTLRALSLTAPYMHDGSLGSLEEVVEFYRKGGHPNAHLDPKIAPLEMTEADVQNLVAFLKAL